MKPYAHASPEIVVLRMIRGNGGENIRTESQRRSAGKLVLAGYVRRLKNGYAITTAGTKVLQEHELQNPYGDVGAY